jgi:hypothetical protein
MNLMRLKQKALNNTVKIINKELPTYIEGSSLF